MCTFVFSSSPLSAPISLGRLTISGLPQTIIKGPHTGGFLSNVFRLKRAGDRTGHTTTLTMIYDQREPMKIKVEDASFLLRGEHQSLNHDWYFSECCERKD